MTKEELLDQLISEAEIDLKINKHKLDDAILAQSEIFTKWFKRLRKSSYEYSKLLLEMEKTEALLHMYYTGRALPHIYKERPLPIKYLKSEIGNPIKIDETRDKLANKILSAKEIMNCIEGIVERIKQRDWQIKSLLDYMKFQSGI